MSKTREMNLTSGPLLKQLMIYALPLMATNVLQLLFNAADVAVLGIFVGDDAVAAVGSTSALINLIIGLFVGLSVGANVLVARFVGEGNTDSSKRAVGVALVFGVVAGVFLSVVGFFCSRTFLEWMACDERVIDMATKYMQIYFLGMPVMLLYNFSASILRAVGDTFRPFIFLVIGGVVNVGLNVLFVVGFHKDVEGVAIATVVAQGISAVGCIVTQRRSKGFARLEWKYLKFYRREFVEMLRIGVPAGIQGCVFSISNVLIQSSINSFGNTTMTANSAAQQIDGVVYQAMNGISLATLAFVGQNVGAGNLERAKKTTWLSVGVITVVGIVLSAFVMLLRNPLCRIFTDDSTVIEQAVLRLSLVGIPYFLCGINEVLNNAVRGLGRSTLAMTNNLAWNCLFRVVWIYTVFRWERTLFCLYLVYPVSWLLASLSAFALFQRTFKSVKKRFLKESEKKN